MNDTRHLFWTLLIGLGLAGPTLADSAFITDKIVVEVYPQAASQGPALKSLVSGTGVEVLGREGDYTRIRSADNTTGWVASKYLTGEQPVFVDYRALLAKHKTVSDELAAAQAKLKTPGNPSDDTSPALRAELDKARARVKELEEAAKARAADPSTPAAVAALDDLKARNQDLENRLAAAMLITDRLSTDGPASPTTAAPGKTISLPWYFGSLIATLAVGAILGMGWFDRRMRKRHGGFRLY